MHVETAHLRSHDRQVFLDLGRYTRFGNTTAAMRALVRKRNVDDLIDGGRRSTMPMATVTATGPPAGSPRIPCRGAFRERRRLSFARAPRRGEFLLQPLVLTLQSFTRLLRFLKLTTQTIELSIEVFERWGLWLGLASVGHAPVMPESALRYKRDPLTSYRV